MMDKLLLEVCLAWFAVTTDIVLFILSSDSNFGVVVALILFLTRLKFFDIGVMFGNSRISISLLTSLIPVCSRRFESLDIGLVCTRRRPSLDVSVSAVIVSTPP